MVFSSVSCSGAADGLLCSVTTGSWAQGPRDELLTS